MELATNNLEPTNNVRLGSTAGPHLSPWWLLGLSVFLSLVLVGFGVFREQRGVLHAFDTGLYMQIFENLRHYGDLASSVTGESNFLAHHFQPILLLVLPFYALLPSASTLFVLDACCLTLCILILMHGRWRKISSVFVGTLTVGMLLHPSVAGRLFYSFVPETLALPFLAIQANLLLRDKPLGRRDLVWLILAQVLAGFCKENIWLINAASSAVLAWRFRRAKAVAWTTAVLAGVNALIFAGLFFVWMPAHTNMSSYYALRYYQNPNVSGEGALALGQAMVANLTSLRSLHTLFITAALCGFVPFFGLNASLLAAMPGLLFILTSSAAVVHNPGNHHQLLALPFFWASGLHLVANGTVQRLLPRVYRVLPLVLVAIPLGMTSQMVASCLADIRREPRTHFIASQMAAVRDKVPDKDRSIIVADANLQPFLADYRHVMVLLEFTGNPHKMTASDWSQVTDVVTMFDPRTLATCENLTANGRDQLEYNYQAFYQYCNWAKATTFRVTAYPESGIYHFHR